jgi:uncharacterized damage-inducible protein DinB
VLVGRSLLDDALAHHVWATLRLIDACRALTPEQLEAPVPGTYGSILETLRHLIGGDSLYLSHLSGDPIRRIDTNDLDLHELRAVTAADERVWFELLGRDLDPDAIVKDVDEEGYVREAPIGLRFAQALHHGSDHRSQICTALTSLGFEPPGIDVWDFGYQTGRALDIPPVK